MKDYSELKFTDDFMFCKILQSNPSLCKELTELILSRKIGEVVNISKQLPIEITPDGKGVRFDIYFEDDKTDVYDIEMQVVSKKDLAKRARYYQGMIDLDNLDRGFTYDKLPNSTIIFICLDDIFGKDLVRYTYRNTCLEVEGLFLDDGSEKVFLCAGSANGRVSQELKMFCNYLCGKAYVNNNLISRIESEIDSAIVHQKWRAEYMTLREHYAEKFSEGLEAGRAEGFEVGKAEGLEAGRAEGEEHVNNMYRWLLDNGRNIEMNAAILDANLRKNLLAEFDNACSVSDKA